MVNVTVAVPEEMKKRMDEFRIINWSEVARQAFDEELKKLELLKQLTAKSKASEGDIGKLAVLVKRGVAARHR